METSKYRVIGPRGEGPFEVVAETALGAAVQANIAMGPNSGYCLEQPRGRLGAVVGYEPAGNAIAKVGPFDITWLERVA